MIVLELTVTCRPVEMPPPLDPEFFEIVVEVTVHRQKQVKRALSAERTEEIGIEIEVGWTNLEALLAPIRSGIIPDEAPAIDGGTLELSQS